MTDALPPLPEPADAIELWQQAFSADQMRAYAEQAVAAERERCARAVEQYGGAWDVTTQNFARVIRADSGRQ